MASQSISNYPGYSFQITSVFLLTPFLPTLQYVSLNWSACLHLLPAIWPYLSYRVLNSPVAPLSVYSPLTTRIQSECQERHLRLSTIWSQSNLLALFSFVCTTNYSVHSLLAIPLIFQLLSICNGHCSSCYLL